MNNRRVSLDRLLADLGQPIACVDLETTGGRPQQDRILEIGIVFLSQNEEPREWNQLLNPGCSVPPYISKLTGIHPQMLHGMPRLAIPCSSRHRALGDARVVAEFINAPSG